MEKFKFTMIAINTTFGSALFGAGFSQMLRGNFKMATYILFIVSILYIVGYLTEIWSK